MPLPDDKKEFLLAEYSFITSELHWRITQIVADQRNALISTGAIWAWLATNEWNDIFVYVKWGPVAIVLLFGMKRVSLSLAINELRDYVHRVEAQFELPDSVGWQHNLKARRSYALRKWSIAFWSTLLVGNVVLALIASPS